MKKLLIRLLIALTFCCCAFLVLTTPTQKVKATIAGCGDIQEQCDRCACSRNYCRYKCPASGNPDACYGSCESLYEGCVGSNTRCPWYDGDKPKPRPGEILD